VDGFDARRDAALARLAAGDPDGAFHEVRWALGSPAGDALTGAQLTEGLGLLARILVSIGQVELAEVCARASVAPGDPAVLYELGYRLVEDGVPAVAASVLGRALAAAPGSEPIVTELVAALERMLRYRDARDLLASHPALVASSFLCRYLYAYDAAMCGDLATTRATAPALTPADDTEAFMAARIAQIVARADRVAAIAPLDDHDLRGWHYVLCGGILLHRSPYGFDDAMRGRFAWLQDDAGRVRAGLDRLRALLDRWGIAPPCVFAPPGRDHAIIAACAAAILDVPVAPWPEIGAPAPGIVVAYDLGSVAWRDLERLVERPRGQVLYAHGARWTEDGPICPDVTMLLHQELVAPWGRRLAIAADRDVRPSGPDDRDAPAIAADVIDAAPMPAGELDHDDLAGLDALSAAAGPPQPGRRERLWAGSPVASNRFV
jgi:hypothetical protein